MPQGFQIYRSHNLFKPKTLIIKFTGFFLHCTFKNIYKEDTKQEVNKTSFLFCLENALARRAAAKLLICEIAQ